MAPFLTCCDMFASVEVPMTDNRIIKLVILKYVVFFLVKRHLRIKGDNSHSLFPYLNCVSVNSRASCLFEINFLIFILSLFNFGLK